MMHTATAHKSESSQFGLPDHLPFRNEDADLFSFLDGLGTDQGNQGVGTSRSARATSLASLPSWTPPQQGGKTGPGLPSISSGGSAAPDSQLSRLPLPDVPLGSLPLGEDSSFMHSLSSSTQPLYPYQQMPQHLQPPAAVMTSPRAGTPTLDVPSMPMWSQGNVGPMMHNDDLGGFVPVPPGPLPHSQQPHIHPGLSSPPGSGGYEDWKEGRDSHDEHHSNRMGSHSVPKADAWREKNRLAQKAFRQRQKEKQKLSERQIEELSGRVSALELEKQELQRALEAAKHAHEVHRQNSSGSNPGSSEATSRDADEVVLQLKLGEPEVQYTLTRGDVRHLTLKSMASIWKVLVEKIGVCLPEAGRDPQGRLAKRVAELANEARSMMWAMVGNNVAVLGAFLHCNLEDVNGPARVDAEHPKIFSSILERVQLSEEQLAALLQLRRTLMAHIGALLAEREQIGTRIRSIEDVEDTRDGATMHLQELSALIDQVRANIEAIHVCKSWHMAHAWREIFQPIQAARFVFFSYPYGTDMLSLITCAAKQAGEPSTHDLLRMSNVSPQEIAKWKAPNAIAMVP